MAMIVIHIDTQKYTSLLAKCYEGIEDATILVNPSREEVDKILTENPNERVMMMGHGSDLALFGSYDPTKGRWVDIIDRRNAELLKDRECIGIWCYAKGYARAHGLKGYFTDMFVSNGREAKDLGFKATEKKVFDEVVIYAERINRLLKENVPLEEWVERLCKEAEPAYETKPFVEFNYTGMEYFDGNEDVNPLIVDYSYFNDFDDEVIDDLFDYFCKENCIEGEWARGLAWPIFKGGWDAKKNLIVI